MRRTSTTETTGDHFKRLMALPQVNPERQSLRDAVPFAPKTLAARAKKFTTPAAFLTAPKNPWITNPKPAYPAWVKGTRQSPCLPFESGDNTLPGMEAYTGAKA